jgi:uncharacterized protein (DUF302 family)
MDDYGRRIVVDLGFEAAVSETCRALRDEGLQVIARTDVRDRFWRDLGRDFRMYALLEAWSPELALHALEHDLAAGTELPIAIAVYELADGESAVVVSEPFAALIDDAEWRRDAPELASIADRERLQVARVLERLRGRAAARPAGAMA